MVILCERNNRMPTYGRPLSEQFETFRERRIANVECLQRRCQDPENVAEFSILDRC